MYFHNKQVGIPIPTVFAPMCRVWNPTYKAIVTWTY